MVSYHLSPHRDVVFTSPIPLLHLPSYYKANRFQAQYHSNYNISYMCHKYAILNTADFSAIQIYNRLWINLCTHKMTLKLLSVPSGQPCLLRSGAVFLFSFHGLLSKHWICICKSMILIRFPQAETCQNLLAGGKPPAMSST